MTKHVKFSLSNAITSVVMILIFQLIDMLSCGPIIFFSSNAVKLGETFSDEKSINILKTLGVLCYIYSTIISMFAFSFFSGIQATLVSGVIVESLQLMVSSYSENILKEVNGINSYYTNFLMHLFVTSIAFGAFSLILKKSDCAHLLSLIPKSVVNGCLGAIGFCQIYVGYECLVPSGKFTSDLIPLMTIAFLTVIVFLIIEFRFSNFDFIIPAYSFIVIVVFYAISFIFIKESDKMTYLRSTNWLSEKESVIYPNYVFNRLEPSNISFKALGKNFLSIISIVLMNSVHIAVNLPAYRMATGTDFNFSDELGAQGFSNFFTLIPCYFIASYSITCTNSGGNKRMYGIIAGFFLILLALYGVVIKAFIPRFILSLVPFIVFYGFIKSSFFDTFKVISPLKYLISLIVCITCVKSEIYIVGMVVGLALYIVSFLIMSKQTTANDTFDLKLEQNEELITVDYLLWFLTIKKFRIPRNVDTLILDFTNCKGIDWLGDDAIENACKKSKTVNFIGNPSNFRKHRFSKTVNFFYFENYQAYVDSKQEI